MLRGLRLPGKLVFAAVPLMLALAAVSALLVRESLAEAERARDTAVLAGSLDELSVALSAIGSEAEPFFDTVVGEKADPALRAETNAALDDFYVELQRVGADPLLRQYDIARASLEEVRATIDAGIQPSDITANRVPAAFEQASNELLAVAGLMPTEASTIRSGRDLEALGAISQLRLVAGVQDRILLDEIRQTVSFTGTIERVRDTNTQIESWLAVFEVSATGAVVADFESSPVPAVLEEADASIQVLLDNAFEGLAIPQERWQELLDARWNALGEFERDLSRSVVDRAAAEVATANRNVWVVSGIALGSLLLAGIATALVSRSIIRRVRTVTNRARDVAQEQLPALVEALRDPSEEATLPAMPPIRDRGADEIGDLARSFAAMQSTLEDVARQQLETLRKGVADMFVTLARRNRSLIDRQLALIDQLEAHEEDPETLSDFYRLDHLATRMRRNAESLLVLAGTESQRAWQRPMEVDDVVRAAVGEIEDYRRVDILALEALRVRGNAVSDLSHLLSELLENATSFSPPETRVRVAGHFHDDGYLITISDRGVGLGEKRLTDVNRLLSSPPVVGLALEPTLGLYVVAMLAKRHGIDVRLVQGAPGATAQVVIPKTLYETEPSPSPVRPAEDSKDHIPGPPTLPKLEPGHRRGRRERRSAPATAPPAAVAPSPEGESETAPPEPGRQPQPEQAPAAQPVGLQKDPVQKGQPAAEEASPRKEPVGADAGDGPSLNGLPTRVPGASFVESTEGPTVARSAAPAEGIRSALSSFQQGKDRAAAQHHDEAIPEPSAGERAVPQDEATPSPTTEAMPLPTRVPGTSFESEGTDDTTIGPSGRNPESIRSALGALQTGMETGRRHARAEEDTNE